MAREASVRTKSGKAGKRRGLSIQRILAIICLVAAFLFAAFAFLTRPRFSMFLWAGAAVCMLLDAVLLFTQRTVPALIAFLLAVLCAVLVVSAPAYLKYVPLFDKYDFTAVDTPHLRLENELPENFGLLTNLQSIDMRGSTIDNFDALTSCKNLRELDVREDYAFTQADYDALSAALPDCDIRWSMPIAGNHYDNDTRAIDLSAQSMSADEITQIMNEHPQIEFNYALDVLGKKVEKNATELNLQNTGSVDADALLAALEMLPNVETVDLRGTPVPVETVRALQDQNPLIQFLFTFDVPEGKLETTDTSITFNGKSAEEFAAYEPFLEYMPDLKTLDLRSAMFPEEDINRLQEAYPDKEILFTFSMFGVTVTSADTKVVLDKHKVESPEALESYLKYLPNVQQIDMCDCGIPDEEMAALRERHPDIKIVWRIHFADGYTLRTDAEVFSTCYHCSWDFNSASFAPLQYCTDMLFLDLGHDHVTNIEGVAKLTKLKVLILACNTITDISPLAGLKDLEFLELFSNRITDFSPLAGMTKLQDLNINRNKIRSIEPLLGLPSLKRLWIGACGLTESQLKQLKAAHPDAQINISAGNNPTTAGWREHPHYFTIKEMYKTGKYIPWSE